MKFFLKYIFLHVFLICNVVVYAQDISFSQFFANPLYLNPAFTGSAGDPRISLQYRDQWHSFDKAFVTYSAAFDMPVEKLQGGLGISILNDVQANGVINSLQTNLAYSVYIRVGMEYMLHGAIQAGYTRNSLNTAQLVFADNLDINYGNHGVSAELASISDPDFGFADFGSGVLMYSTKLYFGASVNHLTEPSQSFFTGSDESARLLRKYSAHFGARLPVYIHGLNRKTFDFSPNIVVQKQGPFQQINYGMFVVKSGVSAGAWFRQNFGLRYDAVTLMLGFFKKSWQFNYSYDVTVSGMRADTGGTSEVSLIFLLKNSATNKILPFFNQYKEEFGGR